MALPNFKNKHAKDSLFSPEDYLKYQHKRGKYDKFKPPKGVILAYSNSLMEYVVKNHAVKKVDRFIGDMYLLKDTNEEIAIIGNFGIGGPVVAALAEELIAFGVKHFISIGTAGTLQKNLRIGDLVVCEKAIRDEGVSYHYLKPSKYAHASKVMVSKIVNFLESSKQKHIIGSSWTIDAPYRETIAEARQYQKEGVATVEMEAASLFAVGEYRKVQIGAIFTVSDSLAELQWSPKFHLKKTKSGLEVLYKLAVTVLQ